jgi:hypothetical protein
MVSPLILTGLTNSIEYDVILRAVDINDVESANSNTFKSTPGCPTAPTITGITYTDVSSMSIAFTAPTGNSGSTIINYEYSTNNGVNWFTRPVGNTASPINISVAIGGTYDVVIRAVNGVGSGSSSTMVLSPPPEVPSAPTITGITYTDVSSMSIAFTAPSNIGRSPIITYQYSTDNSGSWFTRLVGTTASPINISVAIGGTYSVLIRAVNGAGSGSTSNMVLSPPPEVPSAPTITGVTYTDASSMSIAFTAPTSNGRAAILTYQYSTDNSGSWFTRPVGTTASPINISVAIGGTYSVLIRAVNGVGSGSTSNMVLSPPPVVPSAPTITGITYTNTTTMSVAFTAPTSNGSSPILNYQYSIDNSGSWITRSPVSTASPISISGLTIGTSYSVLIKAVNAIGGGSTSNVFLSPPAGIPSAPTITNISYASGTAMTVTFSVPTSTGGGAAISGYEYSINNGANWTLRAGSAPTTIAITVLNGSTSQVILRAVTATPTTGSNSTMVESKSATPSAPTISSVVYTDISSMTITFTAPASTGGATITTYQYSTDNGANWFTRPSGTTGSPINISVVIGATNQVVIRAVNANGAGFSSIMSLSPAPEVPSAPTITSVNYTDASSISIAFTAPTSNGRATITNYQYNINSGGWITRSPVATTSPIVISGLTLSEMSSVAIRAINAIGNGVTSNVFSSPPPEGPSAPTISSITFTDISSMSVVFSAPTSNGRSTITTYQYSINGGTDWFNRTSGTTASPMVITGVTNSLSYSVAIRAVNALFGSGSSSNVFASPIPGTPSAPTITNISSVVTGTTSISVSFTAPASTGGSVISNYQYSTDNGVNWITRAGTANPIVIASLINNTPYTVAIRAINANSSTGPSSTSILYKTGTPSIPTIGTITFPSSGQLNVAFTAPTTGTPTDYQYSTDNGTNWTTRGGTANPIVITGLTDGTLYQVVIRGVNGNGPGFSSLTTSATPRGAPTVLQNFQVTGLNKKVLISWYPPASNGGSALTGIVIQGSLDGSTWTTAGSGSALTTSAVVSTYDTGTNPALVNGTTYYFRISASNVTVTGAPTSALTAIPQIRSFYFDPSGASYNDGLTQGTAKEFVNAALLGNGDECIFMDGIHTYSALPITIANSVDLRSLNGADYTELVFTPVITTGCITLQGDASGCSITNLTITAQNTGSVSSNITIGFASTGGTNFFTWPTNITVSGCKFKIGKHAFILRGENITITDNTFERFSGAGADTSQSAILAQFNRGVLNITNNEWTDYVFPLRLLYLGGGGGGTYANKFNSKAGTINISGNILDLISPVTVNRLFFGLAIQDSFNIFSAAEAAAGGLSSNDVATFRLLWNISNNTINHYAYPSGLSTKGLVPYIGSVTDGQGGALLAQWESVSMTDNIFDTSGQALADCGLLQIDGAVTALDISSTLYNNPRFTFRNNSITQPNPFVPKSDVSGNRLLTTTKSVIAQTNMYLYPWVNPQLATNPTIDSVAPGDGTLTVSFSAPDNSGGDIELYEYSIDGGSTWTSTSLTSPFLITGLTNGTTYPIQLRAVNDAGSGAESNIVSGTPSGGEPIPVTLFLTDLSKTYNGEAQTPTVFSDPSGVTNADVSFSPAGATAVGSYVVTATLTSPLYTGADVSGTFVINRASLTVSANPHTRNFWITDTISNTAFTTSTLIGSDTVDTVTISSPENDTPSTSVGVHIDAIIPSAAIGTGLSNYDITYDAGDLTILPTLPDSPIPIIAAHSTNIINLSWTAPVNTGDENLLYYTVYYCTASDLSSGQNFFDVATDISYNVSELGGINAASIKDNILPELYVFSLFVTNTVGISPYYSLFNETSADYTENIIFAASQITLASEDLGGELSSEALPVLNDLIEGAGMVDYSGLETFRDLSDTSLAIYVYSEAQAITQIGGALLGVPQDTTGTQAEAVLQHMYASAAQYPGSVTPELLNDLSGLVASGTPFWLTYAEFIIDVTGQQIPPYPVVPVANTILSIIPVPHFIEIKFYLTASSSSYPDISGQVLVTRDANNMITAVEPGPGTTDVSLNVPAAAGANMLVTLSPTISFYIQLPGLADTTAESSPDAPTGVTAVQNGSSIVVSWDEPNNPFITSYTITETLGSGFSITIPASATRYVINELSVIGPYRFAVVATNENAQISPDSPPGFADYSPRAVPCFPAGTRILTPSGYRVVENLVDTDLVQTADGRAVHVRLYKDHIANPTTKDAPYLVPAHSYGRGLPPADLRLSPLHAFQTKKGLWHVPRHAFNDKVKQYGVGVSIDYYHVECPNYFTDNLVVDGCVVESYAGKQVRDITKIFTFVPRYQALIRSNGEGYRATVSK